MNGGRIHQANVRRSALAPHRGHLLLGNRCLPCAVGRSGLALKRAEGDGRTPVGRWAVRYGLFRPDRMPRPATALDLMPLAPDDIWCDDPSSGLYNRPARAPLSASHEKLWRADHLYDVVLVLGFNDAPVRPGRGSAIFLHLASGEDYAATEGCVAVLPSAMRFLLRNLATTCRIEISW